MPIYYLFVTSLSLTPSGSTRIADYPPGAVYGPRTLPNFEFIWLLQGSARWQWSRPGPAGQPAEGEVLLRPGMLALATAGMTDRLLWDRETPSRHAYVHFQPAVDGRFPPHAGWPTIRSLAAEPVLDGLCDYLLKISTDTDESTWQRSREVISLLLTIFVSPPPRTPERDLGRHLSAVVDHVRRAWTEGPRIVTITELSAACGLSAGHLHRLFRDRFGCGPARALELVRLARAATALQRSNQSIADIAAQAGFSNPYHFSRRFSACYQMPPGAYRGSDADPYEPLRRADLLPVAQLLQS